MQQNRLDTIMKIIESQKFVTVKYLCDKLHYSTATINRDLNELKKQGLIIRSYGGAEFKKSRYTPLVFRSEENKQIKKVLSKRVLPLISEGQTIFIDASTTLQYLAQYITSIKNLNVVTNNLNIAPFLSENKLQVFCLGGEITESPYAINGFIATQNVKYFNIDAMFFSSFSVTRDGYILGSKNQILLYKALINKAKKVVYVVDKSKIDLKGPFVACDFSSIDIVVSDYHFSDEVKKSYPNTQFIEVEGIN